VVVIARNSRIRAVDIGKLNRAHPLRALSSVELRPGRNGTRDPAKVRVRLAIAGMTVVIERTRSSGHGGRVVAVAMDNHVTRLRMR